MARNHLTTGFRRDLNVLWRKDPGQGDSLSRPLFLKRRKEPLRVGGQAVIEGVMMRSPNSMAVAVRKPNGEIVVKRERLNFFSEKKFFSKLPLVRGVLTLLSALVLGMQGSQFSANQVLSEEEKSASSWTMGLTFTVALCFGIFLFFLVPLFLTNGCGSPSPWFPERHALQSGGRNHPIDHLSGLPLGHLFFERGSNESFNTMERSTSRSLPLSRVRSWWSIG